MPKKPAIPGQRLSGKPNQIIRGASINGVHDSGAPQNVLDSTCDICWKRSASRLMQCQHCRISVHPECYGTQYSDSCTEEQVKAFKRNFVCWACQAVGSTVHVRERDETGKRKAFHVTERPTECALCSIDNGKDLYNAMHPLYDHHGQWGRQLTLPATKTKPERLAWVHSLCAFAIACSHRTTGCLYGCARDGWFDCDKDDQDDDWGDEDESVNSALVEDIGQDESITHFVYCLPHPKKGDNAWTRVIHEQQQIKCYHCGLSDKPKGIYRIALQCDAQDPLNEFECFRSYHKSMHSHEVCYQALHVGCAVWYHAERPRVWPSIRRCYYNPGYEDETNSQPPVINLFCDVHARDLQETDTPNGSDKRCFPTYRSWGYYAQEPAKTQAATSLTKKTSSTSTTGHAERAPTVAGTVSKTTQTKRVSERKEAVLPRTAKQGQHASAGSTKIGQPPTGSTTLKEKANTGSTSTKADSSSKDSAVVLSAKYTNDNGSIEQKSGSRRLSVKQRTLPDGSLKPSHPPTELPNGCFEQPVGRAPNGRKWDKDRGVWSAVAPTEPVTLQTSVDGSLIPSRPPVQTSNGLYKQPSGESPRGMIWEARRGVWVSPDRMPRQRSFVEDVIITTASEKGVLITKRLMDTTSAASHSLRKDGVLYRIEDVVVAKRLLLPSQSSRKRPASRIESNEGESPVPPPLCKRVRRVCESKEAEDDPLEQHYRKVLSRVCGDRKEDACLSVWKYLDKQKMKWQDLLQLDHRLFENVWKKVVETFERDEIENKDWSYLFVGKSFDPGRALDLTISDNDYLEVGR